MKRWFWLAGALMLASCGTFTGQVRGVPSREAVGFLAHDPAGAAADAHPTPEVDQQLSWETSQICTLGATTIEEERLPAENDGKLVDRLVRCKPYGFNMLGISFAGLVPF